MIAILAALLLVLAAGYLIGSQHERDRHRDRRTTETPPTAPEPLITDREWERFVIAIYELADRDNGQT